MKDFIKILQRFLPPYKSDLIMSFVYNLFAAVFGIFSFVMLQPVLEILFKNAKHIDFVTPQSTEFSSNNDEIGK